MASPRRKKTRPARAGKPRPGKASCGDMSASCCEEVLDHVYEFINSHDVTKGLGAEIRRHLDDCRGCFTKFEFQKKLLVRLKEAGCCECPDSLKARVEALVKKF